MNTPLHSRELHRTEYTGLLTHFTLHSVHNAESDGWTNTRRQENLHDRQQQLKLRGKEKKGRHLSDSRVDWHASDGCDSRTTRERGSGDSELKSGGGEEIRGWRG